MKVLDIAFKDLLRSVRSASFLAFGFVVPLLVSGIFYLAFGGLASGDGGFDLPTTSVQVVNQDQVRQGLSAGQMLVEVLQSENLSGLIHVTEAADPASARAAVDRQEAGVAVIIPADLTAAMLNPEGQAAVELYQDPTLTLGPGIVKGTIQQVVDGFAGSKIATGIAYDQLTGRGVAVDAALAQSIALQYGQWAAKLAEGQQGGSNPLLEIRSPAASETGATDTQTNIISMIMAGMMVFYVFFTGAASAQSLLEEEEAGTLPRLFTTSTSHSAILGGRLIATLVTLIAQVVVLLAVSALIFGIGWGKPLAAAVVTLGMILLAASFGLAITSLLKNTRQAGIVYGGVMTIAGMVGTIGVFTANVPGSSREAFATISLLVPQGWAVRGWELLLKGGGVGDVLPTVAVTLALSIAFFAGGVLRFRRRFA